MQFQAAATLRSRTYLGLILAQFLAAFNDQAIHIVAIFYASDMLVHYAGLHLFGRPLDEKAIISVVTSLFILPFFLFSTIAGMLADKYSKRATLVFWKMAEVAMMGTALVGFVLPHLASTGWAQPESLAISSALLVVAAVFLMGTHSAFFVPAKYGVMPEILQPVVLSRGNGFLEGTSFTAQIIGTTVGGILYSKLKSTIIPQVGGNVLEPGQEWLIGLLLFGLAVLGAVASLMIERLPAADPERRLTWKLWQPLIVNLRMLLRSRPLALAVLGIAFFAFVTLYARQTLLYRGETEKELIAAQLLANPAQPVHGHADSLLANPTASSTQNAELRVAFLIALIGLGVGFGAPMAGALSGNKVELGLVPIGAVFLIIFTGAMAFVIGWPWLTRLVLILVGFSASFYIVPLYTLLQHRAPKDSKGSLVATSNFVNVAGGLLSVAVFYAVALGLEALFGLNIEQEDVLKDASKLDEYLGQLQFQLRVLPGILFIVASLMTAGMLFLLCRQLPDFFVRALLWLRSHGRYRLKVVGIHNLPSDGPVILATNCDRFETCMQVVTATDRFTRFVLVERDEDERPPLLLRYLARRTGLIALPHHGATREMLDKALAKAAKTLAGGNLLGVTADGDGPTPEMVNLLREVRKQTPAPILPVYCGALSPDGSKIRRMQVVIGHPLPADATPAEIRKQIHLLGEWMQQTDRAGEVALTVKIPGVSDASPKAKV